jgi:hypothetical protein
LTESDSNDSKIQGFNKNKKKDPTIQPPAKLKTATGPLTRAKLEYHGCKKSDLAIVSVAPHGTAWHRMAPGVPPADS